MNTPPDHSQPVPPEILEAHRSASARVPDNDRSGHLAVEAPRVTRLELETVKTALEHPPQKPDIGATIVSMLSALLFAAKVVHDSVKDGRVAAGAVELVGFTFAACLVVVMTYRLIVGMRQKHPFHDKAKKYVDDLMQQSQGGPGPG